MKPATRTCLRCGRAFKSTGPGNRYCGCKVQRVGGKLAKGFSGRKFKAMGSD